MKKSSLVSRFAASTALLAAAVVLLVVVVFVVLHGDYFHGTMNAMLRGFSLSMAEAIWRDSGLAPMVARRHQIGVVVEDQEGRYAFGSDGEPVDSEEPLSFGGRYRRIDLVGPDGRKISIFWDMADFAQIFIPPLVGLLALLLVMIGATYAFQLAQLRPLRWLRTGVDAVSRGDFSTRVPVVRQDDIGRVAGAFNQMTRRVEEMMNDRERLLGDVSHELRSPLTRIKVALELIPDSGERDSIAKDVRAMESLTTALLEREHVRVRADRADGDPVDLAAVSREVVDGFAGRPPGVDFVAEPDAGVEIRGDANLLSVLVHNLVDNAVKFSLPDSGPVEVSVRSSDDAVELTVCDDGRGIPEAETERVFEPFVKLDPARGHRTGYGLGLNLCRRIVEAHGGTIEIGGRGDRGTRVVVLMLGAPASRRHSSPRIPKIRCRRDAGAPSVRQRAGETPALPASARSRGRRRI